MMELFLMTLVVPMFGIFGAILNSLVGSWAGKQLFQKKGVPPAPVGGILPTVASLFAQKAKEKQMTKEKQMANQSSSIDQMANTAVRRDTGQGGGTVFDQLVRQAMEKRLQNSLQSGGQIPSNQMIEVLKAFMKRSR